MRALIVGASGFIGSALRGVFGAQAVGTYCTHPVDGLLPLDIRDAAAVGRLVSAVRPQLIIHPAAQPHVDRCEDHVDESYAVNVTGTRNVAAAAIARTWPWKRCVHRAGRPRATQNRTVKYTSHIPNLYVIGSQFSNSPRSIPRTWAWIRAR